MRLKIEWSWVRIPLRPLGNFGNFLDLTLPVSFGRNTKTRWSLLCGACAIGSKRSLTRGKCVNCRGLHILPCYLVPSSRIRLLATSVRGSSSPSRSIVSSHVADGGSARVPLECVQPSWSSSPRSIHSPEHHVIFHPCCSHHVPKVA